MLNYAVYLAGKRHSKLSVAAREITITNEGVYKPDDVFTRAGTEASCALIDAVIGVGFE